MNGDGAHPHETPDAAGYRPPRDCPVCGDRLQITQLGCPHCGTGLSGQFRPCEFCGLDEADRELLRVFLASRGNLKDVERHLGVSYPTARGRFDDLLRRLGVLPGATPTPPASTVEPSGDPAARLEVLRAVARGELDVADALRSLADQPPV